jgi:hypothetical protein
MRDGELMGTRGNWGELKKRGAWSVERGDWRLEVVVYDRKDRDFASG